VISEAVMKGILWSPRQLTGLEGNPQNVLVPCIVQKIEGGSAFNSVIVKNIKSRIALLAFFSSSLKALSCSSSQMA